MTYRKPPLTPRMVEMLRQVAAHDGKQFFAPSNTTRNALAKRGLLHAKFIGMRWWQLSLTPLGRAALAKST